MTRKSYVANLSFHSHVSFCLLVFLCLWCGRTCIFPMHWERLWMHLLIFTHSVPLWGGRGWGWTSIICLAALPVKTFDQVSQICFVGISQSGLLITSIFDFHQWNMNSVTIQIFSIQITVTLNCGQTPAQDFRSDLY